VAQTANGAPTSRYDVFLSLAGCDREPVRRLRDALEKGGLKVFLDEDKIRHFAGITPEIERGLRSSKTLLAYYSAGFSGRTACQFELTAAFLAGQREGDPIRRIIVINPEETTEHLYPVELSDARFALLPAADDDQAMSTLVSRIRARVADVAGTFADVGFAERPRWFAERVAGAVGFVGRYRELWELHTALHRGEYALTQELSCGSVVGLVGIPGCGKTALAAAYAWQFGAAFRGGVYWISLVGAAPEDALARYADQLRGVARLERLDIDIDRADRAELIAALADRLATREEPSLWVIDDVPPDLDDAVVQQLLLPAGPRLRTILITRQGSYQDLIPSVEVGRMSQEDAILLLRRHRDADTDGPEATALRAVADRLGGHAFALNMAGRLLRHRQGIESYADYARRLEIDPEALTPATDLVREAIIELDATQRLILQLALVCAPAPLPVQLIDSVVTANEPVAGAPADKTANALVGLRDQFLATRTGTLWQMHTIVLDAARRYLPPEAPAGQLAKTAARAILVLAAGLAPDEQVILIPHAAALSSSDEVDGGTVEALLRLIAGHYQSRGEPVLAARYWEEILDRNSETSAVLVAAADANHAAGEHETAVRYATRARQLRSINDPTQAAHLDRLLAEALDELGRFSEADSIWARLAAKDLRQSDLPRKDAVATRVAYIRSRRIRGQLREALGVVHGLLADLEIGSDADAITEELQAARIELARIQLSTNAQQEARQTAASVVRHYEQRGLPEHSQSLTAQAVLAEARLALQLWELRPDRARWERAAESLQELCIRHRETRGPMNAATLTTEVEYGHALLCLGKAEQARSHLAATFTRTKQRFHDRHPLSLSAALLLAMAHAQLWNYQSARELYEMSFVGLRAVLGPNHPQTLKAQYGLGIALMLTGNRRRAAEMISAVRQAAPSSVGHNTDLYLQSLVATGLLPFPSWLWRWIGRLGGGDARE
jgi:hypothetical protein